MFDSSWPGWTLMQSGISAAAGLLGVVTGAWMTSHNQAKERKQAHVRQQLQEFYSPMLGMKEELAAKEQARSQINDVVRDIIKETKEVDVRVKYNQDEVKTLGGLRQHDHEQWEREIFPLHKEMLEKFTQQMWLAEPSTRTHYRELTSFVEQWNRWEALNATFEVAWKLDLSGENLTPFYDDLEHHFKRLQKLLND